jgi:Bbp16-like protein
MIRDGLLTFTGTSNGATGGISSGAQTDIPTTGTQVASNIIDLGVTSGLPASAVNGGGARDIGVGDDPMLKLSVICAVAFNNSATLQLILQGAADAGSNTPSGTWTTMWSSPVFANASLIAGVELANVDVPRVVPGQVLPRFLRLEFVTAVGTNSTGTINAGIVIDRFDQIVGTTGVLSGYPAGINVAN